MKNYRLYDITDFVIDDDFIRWVQYREEADNLFWHRWLNENPDKHLVVAEAERIVTLMPCKPKQLHNQQVEFEAERLLTTIRQPEEISETKRGQIFSIGKWWWAAAAILIGVAGGLYFLSAEQVHAPTTTYAARTLERHLTEKINDSDTTLVVNLPDGSTIELAANSRLSYDANLDTLPARDIYLSGEAFFQVVKNPKAPFRVFANEIVTKVLGTSFIVRSFETDSLIKVTVRTGKVSVYDQQSTDTVETAAPNKLSGIIVTCNQQLVYKRSGQKFQKVLLDDPVIVRKNVFKPDLLYEDASLEKVFNDLSNAYAINLVFDADAIRTCTVTADLNNESFFQKLDLVCKAVGAEYEVADGQVIINSKGCK